MMTRLPWKSVAILVAAGVIACGVGFWYRTAKGTIAIQLENPLPHAFKNNPEGMAWLVLLVAFLTAAIVQLWKELSDFRSDYQRETVRKWLAKREMAAEKRSAAERPPRETAAGHWRQETCLIPGVTQDCLTKEHFTTCLRNR
jgi:hypothetical protein